jgi:tetratricopeptide (TPR) repeat protein
MRRAFCFCLVVTCLWWIASPSAQGNPDALYRDRENTVSAERAADLWQARASTDFDAAWKLARISYWLGTHGPHEQRKAALDRGITAGTSAIQLSPNRPDGHFWLAANMGALAEEGGMSAGLKYRGQIRDELQRTLAIDPKYEEGSAEAALGQWYAKVPGMFGGSKKDAESHLRRAIAINPESRTALVDLARLLMDDGRKDEARLLLRRAIDAPIDPAWAPEDKETAAEAAALLKKLDK